MRHYHSFWSMPLGKASRSALGIYVQWHEGDLEEIGQLLARLPLPPGLDSSPATKNRAKAHAARVEGWIEWCAHQAHPSCRAYGKDNSCALAESVQIGPAATMIANHFDIPEPFSLVGLAERGRKSSAGANSPFFDIIDKELRRWWRTPAHRPRFACVPAHTPFLRRAQAAIEKVGYGQTASYLEIAQRLGSAPRAVGQACRRNHLPLIIPCHRIVGSHSAGGYLGHAARASPVADKLKMELLAREGVSIAACPALGGVDRATA